MYEYLLEQERIMIESLDKEEDLNKLKEIYEYSKTQIAWISHERLVHLIVTLFTAWILLNIIFIADILKGNMTLIAVLFTIVMIVLMFYLVHYYRLENGVQRLYKTSNKIYNKIKMEETKK